MLQTVRSVGRDAGVVEELRFRREIFPDHSMALFCLIQVVHWRKHLCCKQGDPWTHIYLPTAKRVVKMRDTVCKMLSIVLTVSLYKFTHTYTEV